MKLKWGRFHFFLIFDTLFQGVDRAVAAYSKVVRRKKSSSAEGTRWGRAREEDYFPLSKGGSGGLHRENILILGASMYIFNVFLCVWDQIPVVWSRSFARKDISCHARNRMLGQNCFQTVTIFFLLFFLQHVF